MKNFFPLFLVLGAGQLIAQPVVSKVYGPGGNKQSQPQYMAAAPDSGYFMAGGTGDPNTPGSAFLVRVAANGDTLWTAGFGANTPGGDGLTGVVAHADGSCAVSGTVNMPFANQQFVNRMVLAKFSAGGQLLWAHSYSPPGYPSYGGGLLALPDGGYLVMGSQQLTPNTQYGYDAFLCRVDSAGNLVWSKAYRRQLPEYESFTRGRVCPDGSFLIAGSAGNMATLSKISATGGVLWTRYVSAAGSSFSGQDVELKPNGGAVLMGPRSTGQSLEMYAMSFDPSGDTLWTAHYGSPVNSEWAHAICATPNGFLLTGTTESFSASPDVWLTAIDTLGQVQWSRGYGDGNWQEGWHALPAPGGGYAMAAREQGSPGAYRFWFFKTDSIGISGLCSEYAAPVIQDFQPAAILAPAITVVTMSNDTLEPFTVFRGMPAFNNCILLPVEETTGAAVLNVYPNPAQDRLVVALANHDATIRVFDAQGKLLVQNVAGGETFVLNVASFAPGIYCLSVTGEDGNTRTEKFVISR